MKTSKSFILFVLAIQLLSPVLSFAAYVDPVTPVAANATVLAIPGNIQIADTTTRSDQTNCDSSITEYAFYEKNPVSMKVQSAPQGDNKRVVTSSRILKYDPFGIFATGTTDPAKLTFPSITNIVPSFKTTTSKIVVVDVAKTSLFQKAAKPMTANDRKKPAAQLVSNMHYQSISTTSTTNEFNYTYQILNATSVSNLKLFSNKLIQQIQQTSTCFDYYYGYCGDGVIDGTDSKGITKEDGTLVSWHSFVPKNNAPKEVCDDGADNGKTGKCKIDCTGLSGPAVPTCTLNATTGANGAIAVTWNIQGTYTNTPTLSAGSLSYTVPANTPTGSHTFDNAGGGVFTFTLNPTNAQGPGTCSSNTLTVITQDPKCNSVSALANLTDTQVTCYGLNAANYKLSLTQAGNSTPVYETTTPSKNFLNTRNLKNLQPGNYTATCSVIDASNKSNSCQTGFVIAGTSKLSINKSLLENKTYAAGDLVGFKIDFANTNSNPTTARIEDMLPNGMDYVSHSLSVGGPFTVTTGTEAGRVKMTFGNIYLAGGQSGSIILTGRVKNAPDACQNAINNVFIYGNTATTADNFASAMFTCADNISLTKTTNKGGYHPGEVVNFTISLTNNGPDTITGVAIQDLWPNPACLSFDGKRNSNIATNLIHGTQNGATSIWTLDSPLTVGQTFTLSFNGQLSTAPSCAGTYTNNVKSTYFMYGRALEKNSGATFAVGVRHIRIIKTMTKQGFKKGDPIEFRIDLLNDGGTAATFNVTDTWPSALNFGPVKFEGFKSYSTTNPTHVGNSDQYIWGPISLGAGEGGAIIIQGSVK